jgi:PhzF family phenazine biosynthesis protein
LRIFTPHSELPFAGHPIVGTWNCLGPRRCRAAARRRQRPRALKHEVGIGVLPIEVDFKDNQPVRVTMDARQSGRIKAEIDDWKRSRPDIARGLGLSREDLDETLPIQACSTGNADVDSADSLAGDLGRCRPNCSLLEEVYVAQRLYEFRRHRLLRLQPRDSAKSA